jgi:hypothetical protein
MPELMMSCKDGIRILLQDKLGTAQKKSPDVVHPFFVTVEIGLTVIKKV